MKVLVCSLSLLQCVALSFAAHAPTFFTHARPSALTLKPHTVNLKYGTCIELNWVTIYTVHVYCNNTGQGF